MKRYLNRRYRYLAGAGEKGDENIWITGSEAILLSAVGTATGCNPVSGEEYCDIQCSLERCMMRRTHTLKTFARVAAIARNE